MEFFRDISGTKQDIGLPFVLPERLVLSCSDEACEGIVSL